MVYVEKYHITIKKQLKMPSLINRNHASSHEGKETLLDPLILSNCFKNGSNIYVNKYVK